MAQKIINRGTSPNDGTGDTLYAGAGKINDNFTEVYNSLNNQFFQHYVHLPFVNDWSISNLQEEIASYLNSTTDLSPSSIYNGSTPVPPVFSIGRTDNIHFYVKVPLSNSGSSLFAYNFKYIFFSFKKGVGNYGTNGTATALASEFNYEYERNVNITSNSVFYDLGEIGTQTIEDAVNAQGEFETLPNVNYIFECTRSGDEYQYWYQGLQGGDIGGLTGLTTTEDDFIDLGGQSGQTPDLSDYTTFDDVWNLIYDRAFYVSTDLIDNAGLSSSNEDFIFLNATNETITKYFCVKDSISDRFSDFGVIFDGYNSRFDIDTPYVVQDGYTIFSLASNFTVTVDVNLFTHFNAWFYGGAGGNGAEEIDFDITNNEVTIKDASGNDLDSVIVTPTHYDEFTYTETLDVIGGYVPTFDYEIVKDSEDDYYFVIKDGIIDNFKETRVLLYTDPKFFFDNDQTPFVSDSYKTAWLISSWSLTLINEQSFKFTWWQKTLGIGIQEGVDTEENIDFLSLVTEGTYPVGAEIPNTLYAVEQDTNTTGYQSAFLATGQSITANTNTIIDFTGGTFSSDGGFSLLDASGKITPLQEKDVVTFDLSFEFSTPNTQGNYDVWIDVNGTRYRSVTKEMLKSNGVTDYFSLSFILPVESDFFTYGGVAYINSTEAITISNKYCVATRTHKKVIV